MARKKQLIPCDLCHGTAWKKLRPNVRVCVGCQNEVNIQPNTVVQGGEPTKREFLTACPWCQSKDWKPVSATSRACKDCGVVQTAEDLEEWLAQQKELESHKEIAKV